MDALPLVTTSSQHSTFKPLILMSPVCQTIKSFQDNLLHETEHLDQLLYSLQQYYTTIKTKHQLQLEVPAGFHQMSHHNRELTYHLHSQRSPDLSSSTSSSPHESVSDLTNNLSTQDDNSILDSTINTQLPSATERIPTIRSVDKPSSTLPQTLTVSEDFLRASLGFRRIDTIKKVPS